MRNTMEKFIGSQSAKEFMQMSAFSGRKKWTENQVEKAARSYIHEIKKDRRNYNSWFYDEKTGEPLYDRDDIEDIKLSLTRELIKDLKQAKLLK